MLRKLFALSLMTISYTLGEIPMTCTVDNPVASNRNNTVVALVPEQQLMNQSLCVCSPGKFFPSWSQKDHTDSYILLRRITQAWKTRRGIDQYMVYGKIDAQPFRWEIIPYQKCRTSIGRMVQQISIVWRIAFGGILTTEQGRADQAERDTLLLEEQPFGIPCLLKINSLQNTSETLNTYVRSGSDAFCTEATINRQWVITGRKVSVLFNYAPIGFGGERLHFLVIPKTHREYFGDISEDEYSESMELTTKLVDYFLEHRNNVRNIYLFHKTGRDAGQTVRHWHLHIIFSTNAAQDFLGKITVIKNILFGSSPMHQKEFSQKVEALRTELQDIA